MSSKSNIVNCRVHAILLVSGYARQIEASLSIATVIPSAIIDVILKYYPKQFTIYGIGKNEYGEFGLNHDSEALKYQILPQFSQLLHDISELYWGSWRFLIKHHPNKLYSVGANDDGDCGVGEKYATKTRIVSFTEVDLSSIHFQVGEFINIVSYGFTAYHTFMATSHNRIIAFGSNVGNRIEPRNVNETQKTFRTPFLSSANNVLCNVKLKQIECGVYFTLFVAENGTVYGLGSNSYGNCGIDVNVTKWLSTPTLIPCLNNVKYLRCGSQHTLCIRNKYELYVFGKCTPFELGLGGTGQKDLGKDIQVEYIDCGDAQSLVIDTKGQCWTFGDNHCGQCGSDQVYYVSHPLLFQSHDKFKDVHIGFGSCGYTHTILLDKNRQTIYGFGSNDNHEVHPLKPTMDIRSPQCVEKEAIGVDDTFVIESVYAGDHVTIVVGYQT